MRRNPESYQIYKHFKGKHYQILALAHDSETGESMVVYQALYSPYKIWVRGLAMFMSPVDKEKYPSIKAEYRFTLQEDEGDAEEKRKLRLTPEQEPEQEQKLENQDFDEETLDPLVMEFLESDTYEEKLNIIAGLHHRITNEMITTMAIAIDVEVGDGDIEDRFLQLQNCLSTMKKYEGSRQR